MRGRVAGPGMADSRPQALYLSFHARPARGSHRPGVPGAVLLPALRAPAGDRARPLGNGGRVPPEPDLASGFARCRARTVRQALARLEQRGLIRRRKGQGTFVQTGQPGLWLLQSSEGLFQEEVDRLGGTVTSRIVRAEHGPCPPWACQELGAGRSPTGRRSSGSGRSTARWRCTSSTTWPAGRRRRARGPNPNESLYRRLASGPGVVAHGGRRTLEAIAAGSGWPTCSSSGRARRWRSSSRSPGTSTWRPFDCYRAWLRTDRTRVDIHAAELHAASTAAAPRPVAGYARIAPAPVMKRTTSSTSVSAVGTEATGCPPGAPSPGPRARAPGGGCG